MSLQTTTNELSNVAFFLGHCGNRFVELRHLVMHSDDDDVRKQMSYDRFALFF